MESFLFIVNPIAGGGRAISLKSAIEEMMEEGDFNYDLVETSFPGEATEIASEKAGDYTAVVAVGGDGTINEVARGLIQAGQGVLGIIPGGTGNDLARALEIPLDLKGSLRILLSLKKKKLDICRVNKRVFLNIASIGFDAETIVNHNKFKKKIKGRIVYLISVIYTLFNYKNKRLKITIDGEEIEEEILLLAMGNGKYYGGGMQMLPFSIPDDGNLHLCIVSGLKKIQIPFLLPTLIKGTHLKYKKYVKTFSAKKVLVESDKGVYTNLDGEALDKEKEILFEVNDKKLDVIY